MSHTNRCLQQGKIYPETQGRLKIGEIIPIDSMTDKLESSEHLMYVYQNYGIDGVVAHGMLTCAEEYATVLILDGINFEQTDDVLPGIGKLFKDFEDVAERIADAEDPKEAFMELVAASLVGRDGRPAQDMDLAAIHRMAYILTFVWLMANDMMNEYGNFRRIATAALDAYHIIIAIVKEVMGDL